MTACGPPFPIGVRVQLRGCHFGEPGAVLQIERRKVVVYWQDLDFLSRHGPDSLVLADGPMPPRNRHLPLTSAYGRTMFETMGGRGGVYKAQLPSAATSKPIYPSIPNYSCNTREAAALHFAPLS